MTRRKATDRDVREFLRDCKRGWVFADDQGRVWVYLRRPDSRSTRGAITNRRRAVIDAVDQAVENGWITPQYTLTEKGQARLATLETQ